MEHISEMGSQYYWIAAAIFIVAYIAIISEKIDKTKVALLAGSLMVALPILTQEEAFHSTHLGVDYNVIYLLIGMMIMINIMSHSGLFEWLAIKSAQATHGVPWKIFILFIIITAVSSALLDNVTTVLLLGPVTLLIADELDISPIPFLLAEAMASNIGGTATLIGDPPNIMISSKANLSFSDFLVNLAPVVVIILIAFVGIVYLVFKKQLVVDPKNQERLMKIETRRLIKDKVLAIKSCIVLGIVILGFSLHSVIHMEPATLALLGAAVLLLISKKDPHYILRDVEWNTIFFFIGLFILVGGVVKVGLINDFSQGMISLTGPNSTNMMTTSMVMLWFSGIASAIVDNIPYVATMIPLVQDMASQVFHNGAIPGSELPIETLHNPVLMPVWWTLALGACLGGNGSPIGASANVIIMGMAKKAGKPISFMKFVAYGFPIMILSLAIASVYVWFRYY